LDHEGDIDFNFVAASSRKATSTAGSTIGRRQNRNKNKNGNDGVLKKRHSVGHSVGASVAAATKLENAKKQQKGVTFNGGGPRFSAPKLKNTNSSQALTLRSPNGGSKRRSVLFNRDENDGKNGQYIISPLRQDTAYDMIDGRKWDIEELLTVETEQEFHAQLSSHSKEDIIELCWDLLRSKDKSDELLGMVSTMNHDLAQVESPNIYAVVRQFSALQYIERVCSLSIREIYVL